MRDVLRKMRPDRFEDIIALVALYRPGPMDLIPDFIARKHGQQRVEYLDPRLEPIIGPTYGIMVYQEQVMQVAQRLGGYSLGGADLLRRAMGKKIQAEMDQQRARFVAGLSANFTSTLFPSSCRTSYFVLQFTHSIGTLPGAIDSKSQLQLSGGITRARAVRSATRLVSAPNTTASSFSG